MAKTKKQPESPKLSQGQIESIIKQLKIEQDNLSKKDIASWRRDHQIALNIENPKRTGLYNLYDYTVAIDSHVKGVVMRTKQGILQKKFRLVKNAVEDTDTTNIFEAAWFKVFMDLALDAHYYGHSLIEFGRVIQLGERPAFETVSLIPRKHVCPEYGVLLVESGDEPGKGIPYRENFISTLVEVGEPKALGAFLEICPQAISKKHAQIFWDNFAEKYGIPILIATLTSRDKELRQRATAALRDMGSNAAGVFDDGISITPINVQTQGGFEVFDRRILRAEEQISVALAGQTMVFSNGASRAQGEVHERGFEEVKFALADKLKDTINDKLIPLMILNGFPLDGYRFEWNDAYEYTPDDMYKIEQMILGNYEVDPQYFVDKYGIKITGKKEPAPAQLKNDFDFFA